MKKILMIATGGTIASRPSPDGLAPGYGAKELIEAVPALRGLCDIEHIQLFNIDSTEMRPEHWCGIAEEIKRGYDRFDGFVITHGTDTMAYTAAALSYLVQNAEKPILLTGAQRPPGYDGSDARTNLYDSFVCACSEELAGVLVVFDGEVILGTRARKTSTKSLNAFESVNFPPVARVTGGRVDRFVQTRNREDVRFYDSLDQNIGLIKLHPGMTRQLAEYAVQRCDALVIEGYGAGGLPFPPPGKKITVICTQAVGGGSDLSAYAVGRRLKKHPNLLEGFDMTPEAVITKLMWVLAQTDDPERVKKLFYTPVAFDVFCDV